MFLLQFSIGLDDAPNVETKLKYWRQVMAIKDGTRGRVKPVCGELSGIGEESVAAVRERSKLPPQTAQATGFGFLAFAPI